MIRISAFADEISPDLNEQADVLLSEEIHWMDFRSAWGINVLSLSDEQLVTVKQTLDANGIGVAAIGSPIGKVPIDTPFDEYLSLFERALTVARVLDTRYIRIFSFYRPADPAASSDPASYRDEVLRRMREMTARACAADIILIHENEQKIYGDTIARCVDLYESVNDVHLRAVLDPANYLNCGQTPYPDAYEAVLPWLEYMHVKDVSSDGRLVVAGEGAARWPDLLRRLQDDGYNGFLALEPHLHLNAADQQHGLSNAALFRQASQALQQLLRVLDWEYA
ncbi:MAG TPA: TIM barrel protein [Ktedonosporobacter sp.]|nr:TIM barrel protein [Ktedonosporobacter sp.]